MKTVMAGERRHDKRVTKPAIAIVIEGTACVTRNWSLAGFLIDIHDLELIPGDEFMANIVTSNGTLRTKAVVVRVEPEKAVLAARFVNQSADRQRLLEEAMLHAN